MLPSVAFFDFFHQKFHFFNPLFFKHFLLLHSAVFNAVERAKANSSVRNNTIMFMMLKENLLDRNINITSVNARNYQQYMNMCNTPLQERM